MSNLESVSLESSLSFLNALLDISILLVVIGLILEFAPRLWSKFAGGAPHHRIEKLGEILVILGVAGELALHIRSGQIEDKIKASQREKIIELDTKIKEDQELLIWMNMPRQLGQIAKCREILKASPTGAKVRIIWQSGVSDGDSFAFFMSTCFSDPEHPWPPKWKLEKPQAVEKLPDGASKTGVTVIANKTDDWLNSPQTPGGFITKALREGAFLHMGIGYLSLDPHLPDDEVIIAIGPKLP